MSSRAFSVRTLLPRGRGLAATAVLAGGVAAGIALAPAADAGTHDTFGVHVDSNGRIGTATFDAYSERLTACDTRRDGQTVFGSLRVGQTYYDVTDQNGADKGCGAQKLSLKEGQTAYLQVCAKVNGQPVESCSAWRKVHA